MSRKRETFALALVEHDPQWRAGWEQGKTDALAHVAAHAHRTSSCSCHREDIEDAAYETNISLRGPIATDAEAPPNESPGAHFIRLDLRRHVERLEAALATARNAELVALEEAKAKRRKP